MQGCSSYTIEHLPGRSCRYVLIPCLLSSRHRPAPLLVDCRRSTPTSCCCPRLPTICSTPHRVCAIAARRWGGEGERHLYTSGQLELAPAELVTSHPSPRMLLCRVWQGGALPVCHRARGGRHRPQWRAHLQCALHAQLSSCTASSACATSAACACLLCPHHPSHSFPQQPPPRLAPHASHRPAGQLLEANANLVLQLAAPFAQDPSIDNLIALRPGQAVGCGPAWPAAALRGCCCLVPLLGAAAASNCFVEDCHQVQPASAASPQELARLPDRPGVRSHPV